MRMTLEQSEQVHAAAVARADEKAIWSAVRDAIVAAGDHASLAVMNGGLRHPERAAVLAKYSKAHTPAPAPVAAAVATSAPVQSAGASRFQRQALSADDIAAIMAKANSLGLSAMGAKLISAGVGRADAIEVLDAGAPVGGHAAAAAAPAPTPTPSTAVNHAAVAAARAYSLSRKQRTF